MVIKNPPKDYYFLKGAVYFPNYFVRHEKWNRGLVKRYNKSMATLSKLRSMTPSDKNTLKYKDNPNKHL